MNDNPFLSADAFPAFDRMSPAAAREALPVLLERAESAVAALEESCEPTWDGRVAALADAVEPVVRAWHLVSHLLSVRNSPDWRAAHEELQPALVAFGLRVAQSRPLHAALRALRDGPGWETLGEGRRRVVEAALRDARDAGVALEGAARERFLAIAARLSECSSRFSDNVLDATAAFALDLREEADVAGLPPSVRALCAAAWNRARAAGAAPGGAPAPDAAPDAPEATAERGPWRVTLEASVYGPFQQYADRRDLREALWRARVGRCCSGGRSDNTAAVREILALRREMADLVGFPDYARLALDSRMAKTPEAVRAAIDRVGAAARPRAEEETASLRAFAAAHGGDPDLRPWDLAYWSRRELEERHGFSPEALRPYFPFPRVLEGLFALAGELFGIAVEPCDGELPVWHPDVRTFRVRDAATGELRARFFLDPFSRPGEKRGGAWMDSIDERRVRADGSVRLPLALLCCNQAPPDGGGRPSLMTLDEVETLFHEFGHALQSMLTRAGDPGDAGIEGVEWDAVELASQFLEKWCVDPGTMRALSRHVETGESVPDDLVSRVRGARTHGQGLATCRQLSFALVDLDLHERVPSPELPDPDAAWDAARARFSTLPPPPEDRFLPSFTHVFSGGYAAGYYSYLWADILAADAFAAFEEAGIGDPAARRAVGRRWADTVLAAGGSRAPADVFRDFRGRDPSPDALLRHKGLLP